MSSLNWITWKPWESQFWLEQNFEVLIFAILLGSVIIEAIRSPRHYSMGETLSNFGSILLHQIGKLVFQTPLIALYIYLFRNFSLLKFEWTVADFFLALLLNDFVYYWHHRLMHQTSLLWTVHVVHHQPEHFNLSMGTRLSFFNKALTYWFYLPLAIVGVPPLLMLSAGWTNGLYQAYSHLGSRIGNSWVELLFVTPRTHAFHHAKDLKWRDVHYGGMLTVWDRMFGTWKSPEGDLAAFGVEGSLGREDVVRNPLKACLAPWRWLIRGLKRHGTRALFSSPARLEP
ncbi:MAG TPA: sterol desaturase family protein [Pseudobdellovibrionaceae bacterium]|nr:sterol desaturase family protein [Pseudobdellovibrionaceae bacterium]